MLRQETSQEIKPQSKEERIQRPTLKARKVKPAEELLTSEKKNHTPKQHRANTNTRKAKKF